jgi:hypothetical protein
MLIWDDQAEGYSRFELNVRRTIDLSRKTARFALQASIDGEIFPTRSIKEGDRRA